MPPAQQPLPTKWEQNKIVNSRKPEYVIAFDYGEKSTKHDCQRIDDVENDPK